MKVGIVGVGAVGTSCAKAMLERGTCRELVLVDVDGARAKGIAEDLSHGGVLRPAVAIRGGGEEAYSQLAGADVVVITAGINEKAGQAIDRASSLGRLLLLPKNAEVYRKVLARLVPVEPQAPILVVTDPPDALADVARALVREHGGNNVVLSSGTYLDSLRFRRQIALRLGCAAKSVNAYVLGEHGTSQVYAWSCAAIGGVPVLDCAIRKGFDVATFRAEVAGAVKHANIEIIEGTGASQHGIGMVTAEIVGAMLRDEGQVEPIGAWHERYGVTLSLPSVIGRGGVKEVLDPPLSDEESDLLEASAEAIANALKSLGGGGTRAAK